jgi:hypothetical protein
MNLLTRKTMAGVALLVPALIDQTVIEEKYANFSPQGEGFKPNEFNNWLQKKGGARDLQIDPYRKSGLKSVLKFCKISVDYSF